MLEVNVCNILSHSVTMTTVKLQRSQITENLQLLVLPFGLVTSLHCTADFCSPSVIVFKKGKEKNNCSGVYDLQLCHVK